MKKFCMFVLAVLFACNAYATTDIASDATTGDCDATTLGTYSGSADLEIKWEPNTIPIRWYNNNTLMQDDTVVHDNVNANTCQYDGTLSRPTNPTRIGYNFAGWKVRPMMDFSTLSFGIYGESWSIGEPEPGNPHYPDNNCMRTTGFYSRHFWECSDEHFNDLQIYEWKAILNNKTIYGTGKCSAKVGNNNNDTWNNASSNWLATYNEIKNAIGVKQYCWCQLTGYKTGDTIYAPNKSLPWIYCFEATEFSLDNCDTACAMFCSAKFITYSGLRNAMLGITQ